MRIYVTSFPKFDVPRRASLTILFVSLLLATGPGAAGQGEGSAPGATQRRLLVTGMYRPEGGLVVQSVAPDSPMLALRPADGSGGTARVVPGDVITHVNGEPVDGPAAYASALARGPGEEARLTIFHGATGRISEWVSRTVLARQRLLLDLRFRPGGGAVIQGIDPQSPALRLRSAEGNGPVAQIVVGDVITHVNGEPVDSPAAYAAALNRAPGDVRLTVADATTGQVAEWDSATVAVRVAALPEATGTGRRTAWVVLAGLTDDPDIGAAIGVSLQGLEQVLKSQVAGNRLKLQTLKGADCNADKIVQTVRSLLVGHDDTLFVYYLGHGAFDPAAPDGDPTGGHFFQIPSGDLMRRDLRGEMEARPGRLKVLISDTCNVPQSPRPRGQPVKGMVARMIKGLTPLEKLLFNARGVVDVGAASPGQYSWYSEPYGGWFTFTLLGLLPGQSDWGLFLPRLAEDTNLFFRQRREGLIANPGATAPETVDALKEQTAMTPKVFRAAVEPDVADADARDETLRTVYETVRKVVE